MEYRASLQKASKPVEHARAAFDSMHRQFLRDLLFAEQGYLCIYCERRIDETRPPPPIDHWNPLSQFLQQVFDWNNLHVSCRTPDTCDDRKKNHPLNLPWPSTYQYENILGITSGGLLYVRNDVPVAAQLRQALGAAFDDQVGPPRIPSTLNLNHPALREARAAAIEAEEEIVEGTPLNADLRQQRATTLLSQARREDFISARVAYLQARLGAGR